MFKLSSLKLWDYEGNSYVYDFSYGLNYIQGKNDTGKTAFFHFLDYMLGDDSQDIGHAKWFLGSLHSAELAMEFDGDRCVLFRELGGKEVRAIVNDVNQSIETLDDYRNVINSFLCRSQSSIADFWKYADQEIGYRTFTLFNFLGENQLGRMNDFFGKLDNVKYRIKERTLFDYLFCNDVAKVLLLEGEVSELKNKIAALERKTSENNYIIKRISAELIALGIETAFTGDNLSEIRDIIEKFDVASFEAGSKREEELAAAVDNAVMLSNQISSLDEMINERSMIASQNRKREKLLLSLEKLIQDKPEYDELVEPMRVLLGRLRGSLSLSDIKMQKEVLEKKKCQLMAIKADLRFANACFNPLSADEKRIALLRLDDYIGRYDDEKIEERLAVEKDLLSKKKADLRQSRLDLNRGKIKGISSRITSLYRAAESCSPFVQTDFELDGFSIEYVKNGNLIQPVFLGGDGFVDYYTGSKARHTLMQFCGYCAFMEMLEREKQCPVAPIVIVDHLSEPFDAENMQGIGAVVKNYYSNIDKKCVQMMLFDSESPEKLDVVPDKYIQLDAGEKTGFNPFFSNSSAPE